MRLRGRHVRTQELIEITVDDAGRIADLGPPVPGYRSPDLQRAGWIGPGLFDLQVNGCLGVSFNSPDLTTEQVARVIAACRAHGVTGLLPTFVTASRADLTSAFRAAVRARDEDATIGRAVPGFHLEGPYISPDDGPRGAHPRPHVRPPDWDEFSALQDAAGGLIRLVTLAPEWDGALRFIERAMGAGVVVALGHTAASATRLRDAVAAGAKLTTHLGNGCAATLPRHDNVIWEQLANDDLWASVIADGRHLTPAVLKSILRGKTPARVVLTADTGSLAGLPAGRYSQWGQDLEVTADGGIVVPGTPYLAGSGAFLDGCIGPVIDAGLSLADAIELATVRQRELLGLPVPRLAVGELADVVLFDWEPGAELVVRTAITR